MSNVPLLALMQQWRRSVEEAEHVFCVNPAPVIFGDSAATATAAFAAACTVTGGRLSPQEPQQEPQPQPSPPREVGEEQGGEGGGS